MNLAAIKIDTAYMTAGRDYDRAAGYEFLIGAYEVSPSRFAADGSPFPVIVHRAKGFKTNAAAKRAGQVWAAANLAESR